MKRRDQVNAVSAASFIFWGAGALTLCCPVPRRAQEVSVRDVLSVWAHLGRGVPEDNAVARPGMDRVHRCRVSNQRSADHAGIPIFREAHRKCRSLLHFAAA